VGTIVVRYTRLPAGPGRQQIRWAMLGIAASVLFYGLTQTVKIIGMQSGDYGIVSWVFLIAGSLFSLRQVELVALTVALLRYRLYDADATISRSIVYGALSVLLLGIFAGSEKLIELMGEEWFGARLGAMAGGLGAAVAAVCIGPIHHRVTHWAEKRFRTGLVRLRDGLPALVGDLRETASPAVLADTILERVERGARARHGAIIVEGKVLATRDLSPERVADWLARSGLDPTTAPHDRNDKEFPLRLPLRADGAGLVGWLLLGPRPDGTAIARDEREALRDIAEPVARGLAVALERERREAARGESERERDRRLDEFGRIIQQVQERLGIGAAPKATLA